MADIDQRLTRKWQRTPLKTLLPAIEEWLMRGFPTPYPVRVRYGSRVVYDGVEVAGLCWREGRKIEIQVRWGTKREVIDTLLHEWAHAHVLRHANVEKRIARDHNEEWGLAYSRIYSAFYDENGQREVLEGG